MYMVKAWIPVAVDWSASVYSETTVEGLVDDGMSRSREDVCKSDRLALVDQ